MMLENVCSGYRRSTFVEELDHLPEIVMPHKYIGNGCHVQGSNYTCKSCEACYNAETNYLMKKYEVVKCVSL